MEQVTPLIATLAPAEVAAQLPALAALLREAVVLDTRQDDPSERLYQRLGYQQAGVIPQYARNADGTLAATVFYYKLLGQS